MPDNHPVFIDVWLDWPNGPNKPPRVKTPTNTVSTVDKNENMVEWRLGAKEHHDRLKIEKVKFYTDASKKHEADVSQWFTTGQNNGNMNWYMRVKDGVRLPSEITLFYDLLFDDGTVEVDWDPTLKIKPRP